MKVETVFLKEYYSQEQLNTGIRKHGGQTGRGVVQKVECKAKSNKDIDISVEPSVGIDDRNGKERREEDMECL